MKRKHFASFLCLLLLFLSACSAQDAPSAEDNTAEETTLCFSGAEIRISGSGATAEEDGQVNIEDGGTYRVSGSSDRARICVTTDDEPVTLILDGCDLCCPDDEVIYFKSAASVVVELADQSENTLTSGTERLHLADENASGAALRAKCPLTVRGNGSLTVNGFVNNGIASSDTVTLEGGQLVVTASNDGLKSKSDITIIGGNLCIFSSQDGIQADESVYITGGNLTVKTGDGANEADMKVSDHAMMDGGSPEPSSEPDSTADTAEATDTGSRKGIKSESGITISGGTFSLDTADDAIHSGGDIIISGGDFIILSGDDGIHSDTALTISGGDIDVQLSYEGLEAPSLLLSGGSTRILAKDDGLNANGGSMFPFSSGEASGEETDDTTPIIRITGGTLIVDAGGDGLDSNGNLYVEGGFVYVSGPSTNWDAALDSGEGAELVFSGGTVMAAGYSGMMEYPEQTDRSQPTICYTQDEYCPDGASLILSTQDGRVICEYAFAHSFNCVVITSPEIQVGQTYILSMGDTNVEIEMTDTIYSNRSRGGFGGSFEPAGAPVPQN